MPAVSTLPEWRALEAHARQTRGRHLRELFRDEPDRGDRMHVEAAGWYLDYAKHRVDREAIRLLVALATARGLRREVEAMWRGDHVNTTEDRPALHVALRAPKSASILVDGVDVVREVHRVLARMGEFAERVRSGEWRGRSGARVRDVVNIGIGGSDLGPAMAYEALAAYADPALRVRFVSNVDGAALAGVLRDAAPDQTLFVVSSKTFTTLETLTNARSAREWLVGALGEDAVDRHFVAVSANVPAAAAFGIDPANTFELWDWVGGRYSMWSAIGLSLMVAIGPRRFGEMLAGAHAMDEHFRHAPPARNLPVVMALLTLWYRNLLGAQTHAVVPYSHALGRLPAYLQQLEMESNGKSVTAAGEPVAVDTSPVVWGSPGTDGQHAYFQLLHQGTALVPVDFVGCLRPQPGADLGEHHRLLVANLLAQAEALAFGRTADEVDAPHRVMPGNRPSSILVCDELDPHALGALVAAYEHKVATLGVLWGVDSFDQWGVELGKVLADRVARELAGDDAADAAHDSSTRALIERYRSRR
jgi:glucose-6-phosphate isomerase